MIQYSCLGWIVSASGPVQFREAGLVLVALGRLRYNEKALQYCRAFNTAFGCPKALSYILPVNGCVLSIIIITLFYAIVNEKVLTSCW